MILGFNSFITKFSEESLDDIPYLGISWNIRRRSVLTELVLTVKLCQDKNMRNASSAIWQCEVSHSSCALTHDMGQDWESQTAESWLQKSRWSLNIYFYKHGSSAPSAWGRNFPSILVLSIFTFKIYFSQLTCVYDTDNKTVQMSAMWSY